MIRAILIALTITTTGVVLSQTPPNPQQPPQGIPGDTAPGRPPGGPGPGPGSQPELKLVKEFDRNSDDRLDATERKAARAAAVERRAEQRSRGPGGGGPRGPGGRRASAEPPTPGPAVARDQAALHSDLPFYHSNVVRTLFLDFEESDWEKQLEDFHNTDVEVPARMTLDGKAYHGVGIHFRGASSYFMNGPGSKRSLNVSVDLTDKKQNVQGHRTLNLLNCHGDPSFLRAGLYSDIARRLIPTPAHNFVRVVINGESWGLYVGMEQFNKDFVQSWFGTSEGARWKVTGSPRGKGGLEYLGDDPELYRSIYTIKSKDRPEDWAALIRLCKVLNETPAESLEKALDALLNVE
ncbi:MAG: spore coat protein CotH, partial [Verrucomicrobia bacterium]|nr:spore coat protein CotH [Verrucomicrobiota bacterium]